MTQPIEHTAVATPAPRKPIRLWPGAAAAALLVLVWFGVPVAWPDGAGFGMIGAGAVALLILTWWLLFSRAPWVERLGAIALMAAALIATRLVLDESIRGGMMGLMPVFLGIPALGLGLVAGVAAGRRLPAWPRRGAIAAGILLACAGLALVRTDGITGDGFSGFHWRWTPTAEERLLAEGLAPLPAGPAIAPASAAAPSALAPPVDAVTPVTPAATSAADPAAAKSPEAPATAAPAGERPADPVTRGNWDGFRGSLRDGVSRAARIETDWSTRPPVEVWRRPIGPGWSSFAVASDLVYTQEQRGPEEIVACYKLSTGAPVWVHRDTARFYESNGGAGPRGTPAVHRGRVYAAGATGIVNALDAATGALVWSRNGATDSGAEMPDWGFTSSPLIVGDLAIVAFSGRLVAYDIATGAPRWLGPEGGSGYSSPHLATIDGVPQILLLRGSRTISVSPADGTLLWEHTWTSGVGIIQPGFAGEGDVLLTTGDAMGGVGMRRITVARGGSGWTTEERWTSRALKPYFNDFVVHEGHAYGFDGSILAAVDLADGARKWKGGRYGNGQMLLLPEQDLLLVLSEDGELALVSATPDRYTEVAKVAAIEGKTWNHPVLVGDLLLVRNGQEMAAFRLPLAGR